jgi:hypothetical protein
LRPFNVPFQNLMAVIVDGSLAIGGFLLLSRVMNPDGTGGAGGDNDGIISAGQILCTLIPTIFGVVVTALTMVRLILLKSTKAMIIPLVDARRRLKKDLNEVDAQLRSSPLLSALTSSTSSLFSEASSKNNMKRRNSSIGNFNINDNNNNDHHQPAEDQNRNNDKNSKYIKKNNNSIYNNTKNSGNSNNNNNNNNVRNNSAPLRRSRSSVIFNDPTI